ncbi:MAG TPA: hypothetical protein VLM91_06655 [Candidatus Methylomirabilis sp.]|nr:hypothetical protein [Candidatus Methylomirabilis sp.]
MGTLKPHGPSEMLQIIGWPGAQTGWRIRSPAGAAALPGLKPTTLESRIKKLGLQRPR